MQQKAVPVISAQIVDADPKRRCLLLMPASNQTVFVADAPPATTGNGFPLNQGGPGVFLDYERFGDFVCGPFFAISAIATAIGVVEGFDAD
jgi:hypothetical protein